MPDTRGLRADSLLAIDVSREDYYHAGGANSPSLVWCILTDTKTPIRVALEQTHIKYNFLRNPKKALAYGVRVINPDAIRMHQDASKPATWGTLVKLAEPDDPEDADLRPMTGFQPAGGPKGIPDVLEINVGDGSRVVVSENGVQIEQNGAPILTIGDGKIVKTGSGVDLSTPGQNVHGIFKDNLLGAILPKAFLPGLNTPNLLPAMEMFTMADGMVDQALDLAKILGGN